MTAGAAGRLGRALTSTGLVLLASGIAPASAQPPRSPATPGAPPSAPRAEASRDGLDADPDPVGAIIERRGLLALTDAQFAALRDLRRWHQRTQRIVRDSLERLGATAPGAPSRPGTPAGAPPPAEDATRDLRDSLRVWTQVARDSARALLTPAQRDTLAAVWLRFRDSLPARQRPSRGRPPR